MSSNALKLDYSIEILILVEFDLKYRDKWGDTFDESTVEFEIPSS